MSDTEHDEDDFEPYNEYDPGVIQKIEVDLLAAIAAESEAETGIPVVVTSYLVVAEVMDEQGRVGMMWTMPDEMTPQATLGHVHWLLKRVDEAT